MIASGEDLAQARKALGWTAYELALALRMYGDRTALKRRIYDMETGYRPIPGPTAVAVEALVSGWRPEDFRSRDPE